MPMIVLTTTPIDQTISLDIASLAAAIMIA
jgi:hypothetical protein